MCEGGSLAWLFRARARTGRTVEYVGNHLHSDECSAMAGVSGVWGLRYGKGYSEDSECLVAFLDAYRAAIQ